jgi:hypothetical protein
MPARVMTLAERQKLNDTFRQTLAGGRVEMLPAVQELDARIRGRLLFRLSIYQTFHPESDHSDGMFVFAGWTFFFEIHEEQNGFVLIIGMHEQ